MKQDFRENLVLALDTLRAHKLRSFLTVLGVMMGVGVLILVVSLIAGFNEVVVQAVSGFGADTAFISQFDVGPRHGRMSQEERTRRPLTVEDGEAILESCPAVKAIAVSLFQNEEVHNIRYKEIEVHQVDFRGTFPSFVDVYANAALKEGRFFSEAENEHRVRVVVLGENIATTFFPLGGAVGKEILIDGSPYEVIGVFEKPAGGFGMIDEDRRVAIPYYTFRKVYVAAKEHGIRIQAKSGMLDVAVDQSRDLLRRRRSVPYTAADNFSISTSQQLVEQFHSIVAMVAVVTVALSGVGLLVGGVGVMNIMLVSVTERTREIGVRKAIGARRRDIVWQFLLEAMTLTGVGGLVGILISGSIALLIPLLTTLHAVVPMWAVIVGLMVCTGVGLVFGTWPAMKAARLDPVEALRYE